MNGILIEIKNLSGTTAAGKAYNFDQAIIEIGESQYAITISADKAAEIKDCIEHKFNVTITNTIVYSKDGAPRSGITLSLGSRRKEKAK